MAKKKVKIESLKGLGGGKIVLREKQECDVARLLNRGHGVYSIAAQLKLPIKVVKLIFNKVLKEYKDSKLKDVEEHVSRVKEELREVRREAWDAWEQSKKGKRLARTGRSRERGELGQGENGEPGQPLPTSARPLVVQWTEEERVSSSGDVQYLNAVLRSLESERELCGLDAPEESRVSVQSVNWDVFSVVGHGGAQSMPLQAPGSSQASADGTDSTRIVWDDQDEVETKIATLLSKVAIKEDR